MFTSAFAVTFIATVYFALFVLLLLAVPFAARRHAKLSPRNVSTRRRLARTIGLIFLLRAIWFVPLFLVAGAELTTATPAPPVLQIVLVYGGLIGVLTSLAQATEWFNVALKVERTAAALSSLALSGGIVSETRMVPLLMPEELRTRLLAGEKLSAEDTMTLRGANAAEAALTARNLVHA
jgi:cytochrome bd-type quinol oxidase subunit 2